MNVDFDEAFEELISVGTSAENSHMTAGKTPEKFSSSKKWQRQRKISAERTKK
jgi:hypothetical protein